MPCSALHAKLGIETAICLLKCLVYELLHTVMVILHLHDLIPDLVDEAGTLLTLVNLAKLVIHRVLELPQMGR